VGGRCKLIFATAVVALFLLPPALASADDAAVFAAYHGHYTGDLKRASANYMRAIDHLNGSRFRLEAVIRADRRINRLIDVAAKDVSAQQASSEPGTRARTDVIAYYRLWKRANIFEMRAVRASIHYHRHTFDVWYDRAMRTVKKAYAHRRRAARTFAGLGLK
jgi:hypothetical protein